jgi:uncharacterized protein (DUF58 family)
MAESSAYLNPDVLARITSLGLRAQRVVEGTISGQHRSPLHGLSVEFADYREYVPGDDLNRLDWRVYARSNRHYIKQFEEESNLRATLVMDASASMSYAPAGGRTLSKFDYGATMAATLALLLIRQRDAVGLAVFDAEQRRYLRPAATFARFAKIIDTLENTEPDRTTEVGDVIHRLCDQIRRRGLVIIISDLLTDLDRFYEGLGKLQYQGHEVLMIHVLAREELDLPFDGSVNFRDLEGSDEVLAEPRFFQRAYQRAMQQFCDEVATRARLAGMDYLRVLTDEDPGLVLSHFLHRRQTASGTRRASKIRATASGPVAPERH